MENHQKYPIVIFDGKCGFCKKSLEFLRERYQFTEIQFLPFSEENAKIWAFPIEVIANHDRYMFFLSSKTEIHKGYFAFKMLFKTDRRLVILHHLMRLKPIEIAGRWLYRIVSSNRSRLSGSNSTCGI
jgi:predicted DCC family thiol-disulfide oxidoreductase YuxK